MGWADAGTTTFKVKPSDVSQGPADSWQKSLTILRILVWSNDTVERLNESLCDGQR